MDKALKSYAAVTLAYWGFMASDGALRMLVLLQFHLLGYSPLSLAYLFLLYEFMGIVTNLYAGWLASRAGLLVTLFFGLGLQIGALLMLSRFDPTWSAQFAVAFVVVVQAVSGVAKDLAKMSAKSAVKTLAPRNEGKLFRWVATLTGSKNAIKGVGFFLGAFLLGTIGFRPALVTLALGLLFIFGAVAAFRPTGLQGKGSLRSFAEILSRSPEINRLSVARFFLFGARDCWFVVAVPVFLYTVFATDGGSGFFQAGAFMACWIIFYGAIQTLAPKMLTAIHPTAARLALALAGLTTLLAVLSPLLSPLQIILGLFAFGFVFAINSALHSYLVLAYAKAENVSADVGFYYMSNAAGRLVGTLLSGLSFQFGGLTLSLFVAAAMSALSFLAARALPPLAPETP